MENVHLEELKVYVDDFGTLFTVLPDKGIRPIFVEVHDLQHYGVLKVFRDRDAVKHEARDGNNEETTKRSI